MVPALPARPIMLSVATQPDHPACEPGRPQVNANIRWIRSAMSSNYGLEDLRSSVANAALCVPAISEWTIGMHVHHCCLATVGFCRSLIASTPPAPRSKFSFVSAVILTSGRIPRGRGRTPDAGRPRQDVSSAELLTLLDQSERFLTRVKDLDPKAWCRHPVFGVFDRDKTLRFIHIHNRHHLRIISDIVAA